jgi:hypothetical protein
VDFSNDHLSLDAGCPVLRKHNTIESLGNAVVTHRFQAGTTPAEGAVVMNSNAPESWSTLLMSFPWWEIRDPDATPQQPPVEDQLVSKILDAVVPIECLGAPDPATDSPEPDDELDGVPERTALHQNAPNPFNPATTIRFDLATPTHVRLHIYDVSGRLVRALVDEELAAAVHRVTWSGYDDLGRSIGSGIYFYRLKAGDFSETRKLVLMK